MANIINAITTGAGGLSTSADTSGNIDFKSNGTTVASITSSGMNVAGTFTVGGSPINVSGGATNAGLTSSDVTLTSSSDKVQLGIINTSSNISYTLPNATTMSKGTPIFSLQPQGSYGGYIKNNSGNIIGYALGSSGTALYTGQVAGANISLIDNSTSNGLWTINNVASVADYTPPTLYAAAVTAYATCVAPIDTSSWLIMYKNSSNSTWYAIVGSKSGSTITYGTAVQLSASTTIGNGASSRVIALSSTAAMCLLAGTTNVTAIPLVLSGSSITVGSSSTFGSASSSVAQVLSACKVTSTTLAVRTLNTTNLNSYGIYMLQHNGSSAPTVGTAVTQSVLTGNAGTGSVAFVNSTTLIDVFPAVTTGYMNARTLTVSGTSLTNNGNTLIANISDWGPCVGVTLNGTRALIARTYVTQGAYSEVTSINISGTSVSLNTDNIAVSNLYGYQVGNNLYNGTCGSSTLPFYINSTGTSGYVQLNFPGGRSQSAQWVKATPNATTGVLVPSTSKVILNSLNYGTNQYTTADASSYCWLTDGNTYITTGLNEYFTSSWGTGYPNYTVTFVPNALWQ